MTTAKKQLVLKISESAREGLRHIAEQDRRFLAATVEILVSEELKRRRIKPSEIAAQSNLPPQG